MRAGRAEALGALLPRLAIAALPEPGGLEPKSLFLPAPARIWLEIGFGGGEHLVAQAHANPDAAFIGAEPFVNGIAGLLAAVAADGTNSLAARIRVWPDDGAELLAALRDASIDRAFLLFPDPWPKARHHKRRFVNAANLDQLARVLVCGAEWRVATDDADYADWILEHVAAHPVFSWRARRATDWPARPADWPATRYEAKALKAGQKPRFFRFYRRPRR
ncbi:MAG: tRNA (guanine(46)-N(7))-methyltransferase TrmB [Alphaproteobacteria bacterium]